MRLKPFPLPYPYGASETPNATVNPVNIKPFRVLDFTFHSSQFKVGFSFT